LIAAAFFADNFPIFFGVISKLTNHSAHVNKLKALLKIKKTRSAELTLMNAHLAFLPAAITKLEKRGLSLNDR